MTAERHGKLFSSEARARVLAVAESWIGTPFHDGAQIHGTGVDCAHLIAAVYEGAGLIEKVEIESYPPTWFIHRGEERFLAYLDRYMRPIDERQAGPGDTAIWRMGRAFGHAAIVVAWPQAIIHAWKPGRRVLRDTALNGHLRTREVRFYSPNRADW